MSIVVKARYSLSFKNTSIMNFLAQKVSLIKIFDYLQALCYLLLYLNLK